MSCITRAEAADLKAELVGLVNRDYLAFHKGDGSAMDRLEVPNLILVNSLGIGDIWQKDGPRVSQPPRKEMFTFADATLREFGDTAILVGTTAVKDPGSPVQNLSTTVVMVRQSAKWRIASMQWSKVNAPEK
jgi:hypothetical protein